MPVFLYRSFLKFEFKQAKRKGLGNMFVGLEPKILSNGKRIFSKTVAQKTYTRVTDRCGKVLIDRVKSIEKSKVGNKSVITKKEVSVVNDLQGNSFGFKYQSDRVYNGAGKLVGVREIENKPGIVNTESGINPLNRMPDCYHVTKSTSGKSYVKDFENGTVKRKWFTPSPANFVKSRMPLGMRNPQYIRSSENKGNYSIADFIRNKFEVPVFYNNKGLPKPPKCADDFALVNMSLKEMREYHGKKYPENRYAKFGMNLDFLNDKQTYSAIEDLDIYL